MKTILLVIMLIPQLLFSQQLIDNDLKKYIYSFEQFTGEDVTANVIFTSGLPLSVAGVYQLASHTVWINRDFFGTQSVMMQYYIVYHELGHSLGLKHSDKGIMKPKLPHHEEDIYQEFKLGRNVLKKELTLKH